MSSVFISHAVKDTEFAQRLSADLKRGGYETATFADLEASQAGEVSDRVLSDAISSSDYFVPVLTSAIQNRRWLVRDLEQALAQEAPSGRVTILPVLKESCVLPELLGVRSPVDFSVSYGSGLHSLIDRISVPSEHMVAVDLSRNFRSPKLWDIKRNVLGRLWSSRAYLRGLEASKFEKFVVNAFEDYGCTVELTQFTKDGGIDLVAIGLMDDHKKPWLVQCKRYVDGNRVGVELVKSVFPVDRNQRVDETHVVATSSIVERTAGEQVERLTRSRWVLDGAAWAAVEGWLSASMRLSSRPIEINDAHDRYAVLVDKKFISSLSPEEQAELLRLEVYLDEVEADFYEPIKKKLRAALAATTKA